MNETYSIFAKYYDLLMDNYDYDQVYQFLRNISKEYSFSMNKMLEVACGTGELTKKLAKVGKVDAFDRSEAMLAQAYQRLYKNKRSRIFKMDMVDFHLKNEYDSIYCLCDSLNYLETIDKIRSSFLSISRVLKEDGFFIFDLNTEFRFQERYKNHIQVEEGDDFFIVWENSYQEERKRNLYKLNFFTEEKGLYRREIEEHFEYVYGLDEIVQALKDVGLNLISVRNGYTENEDLLGAERLVFIVKNGECI